LKLPTIELSSVAIRLRFSALAITWSLPLAISLAPWLTMAMSLVIVAGTVELWLTLLG
jgi:hypothetical protein